MEHQTVLDLREVTHPSPLLQQHTEEVVVEVMTETPLIHLLVQVVVAEVIVCLVLLEHQAKEIRVVLDNSLLVEVVEVHQPLVQMLIQAQEVTEHRLIAHIFSPLDMEQRLRRHGS
jgi:hypothetical protein